MVFHCSSCSVHSLPYCPMKLWKVLEYYSFHHLKAFTSFNIEAAGISEECFAFAQSHFDAMIEGHDRRRYLMKSIYVGLKVHYHGKSGKLIDLAMSVDELASLHDVYETPQSKHHMEKASYVLQYLWQYTASNIYVIGSYFTSGCCYVCKVYHCISFWNNTLFSLETKAILCDGASTNLCAIKLWTGFGSGAFGIFRGQARHQDMVPQPTY